MSASARFNGVWTAIVTPMKDDGEVDWLAFEGMLDEQAAAGIAGIVVSGTTGEAPTLTVQEKVSLVRKARARLPAAVRVMAGSGGNNTQQSIELSKLCQDAGADSLLVVTPPYNKPSVEGLIAHFNAIGEACKLPVCLYHVPGRTAQFLTVEQLRIVATAVPSVACIKEASGDIAYYSRAVQACATVDLLSGDDPTYLASLAVGGDGVISVVSNVFPGAFVAMTDAFLKGETGRARAIHGALLPFTDSLFAEVNPTPVKYALSRRRKMTAVVRLPLVSPRAGTQELIDRELQISSAKLRDLGCES